ncbi:2,3-bisphosphoglycerate-independent phosphoglycerate mutase [Chlamydia abortus]|nr:2,3-bisphosphoglycerate-independent phosphoglycerate mutase [Chlamydia abortus]
MLISYDNSIKLQNGILADVAPTVLDYANIKKPKEMTGKSLLIK